MTKSLINPNVVRIKKITLRKKCGNLKTRFDYPLHGLWHTGQFCDNVLCATGHGIKGMLFFQ